MRSVGEPWAVIPHLERHRSGFDDGVAKQTLIWIAGFAVVGAE